MKFWKNSSINKVGIINVIAFNTESDNSFSDILQTWKLCQFIITNVYVLDIYTKI